MEPLISVIVPVYKVEQYLDECVQSIINQTYNNLEIILVDDGSPDLCPAICDKYVEIDHRVVVIHKQNEGVCSARNAALSIAKGDYIGFVDGDDYLAPDYAEYMIDMAFRNDADFALSQNCYSKERENQIAEDSIKCLTPEAATVLLLSPRIVVGCWNKMFKRSLISMFRL